MSVKRACTPAATEAARYTSTPTVDGTARTAAATAARRRAYAARIAHELACRLDELDNARLAALAGVLAAECLNRGLAVPDIRV
ncbi:hypothetical protein ACQEVZ_38625 [Dactylosporangium sp. CA-152071]|uniref:hypothetical protein n=1 Tax=Dactylosporangium sp. CA-152071 TaxID=3239933 RepID=UPI003D8D05EA